MLKGRAGRAAGVLTLVLNSLTARLPKFTQCVLGVVQTNRGVDTHAELTITARLPKCIQCQCITSRNLRHTARQRSVDTNHCTKLHHAFQLKRTFFLQCNVNIYSLMD